MSQNANNQLQQKFVIKNHDIELCITLFRHMITTAGQILKYIHTSSGQLFYHHYTTLPL